MNRHLIFRKRIFLTTGLSELLLLNAPFWSDLLVRNGFHAEQNALVLSRDGYPAYIVQRARKMLKESPSLPVYLLHDASEAGMAMSRKNKLSGRTVIDLGIRPEHLEKMYFLDALQLGRKGWEGTS